MTISSTARLPSGLVEHRGELGKITLSLAQLPSVGLPRPNTANALGLPRPIQSCSRAWRIPAADPNATHSTRVGLPGGLESASWRYRQIEQGMDYRC